MLAVTGSFGFVSIRDPRNLAPEIRHITTTTKCRRVVKVPLGDADDDKREMIAVSPKDGSQGIALFDVSQEQPEIVRILANGELTGDVKGLAALAPGRGLSTPRIIAGDSNGNLCIADGQSGEFLQRLAEAPSQVSHIHAVPQWNHEVLAADSRGNSVARYCLRRKGAKTGVCVGHEGSVNGVACDTSRNLIFSVSSDSTAKLWSRSGSSGCVQTLQLNAPGSCVFCASDSGLLLIGAASGEIQVWDLRNLSQRVRSLSGLTTGTVQDIDRVSSDVFVCVGRGVRTRMMNFQVALWNPSSGNVFPRPRCRITAMV